MNKYGRISTCVLFSSARLHVVIDISANFASPIGGDVTTTPDGQKVHEEEEAFWGNIMM